MFRKLLPAAMAAFTLIVATPGHAQSIFDDDGCTGPFPYPSPDVPYLCNVFPFACDDEPPGDVIVVTALIDMGQEVALVRRGSLSPAMANQRIRALAGTALNALHVPAAIRDQTLSRITAINNQKLPGVAAHTVSASATVAALSNPFFAASGSGDVEVSAMGNGDTVTTVTTGGFEINLGIFKITVGQTVTTVETVREDEGEGESESAGYTEECEGADCVCVEE